MALCVHRVAIKHCGYLKAYIWSCALAFSVQGSLAADFKHAKKIYVPPTTIERRLDFNSLRERVAQAYQTTSPASSKDKRPGAADKVPQMPVVSGQLVWGVRQKVEDLLTKGRLEEADELVRRALRAYPKDNLLIDDLTNISLARAKKLLSGKELDEAAQVLHEGLFLNSNSSRLANLLNDTLRQQGIDPASSDHRLKLANLLSSQNKNGEATVEYKASIKLKDNPSAHIGLGDIAVRGGQRRLAITEYQRAVEINPHSWVAFRQMGRLKSESGDLVGANLNLSQAIYLHPADKIAGQTLVELWQHQVARSPADVTNRLGLARAYQLTGDLRSAQSEYRQAVRLDPENPSLPAARESFKQALSRREIERATASVQQTSAGLPHAFSPGNTRDDTGQLSSFLVSLRNHTLSEKKRIEEIESHARKALSDIASGAVLAIEPQSAFVNTASPVLLANSTDTLAHSLRGTAANIGHASLPPVSPDPSPLPLSSPAVQQVTAASLAGAVRLELEGLSPTSKGLLLKVLLRNNQDVPLSLPARPTAVIRGERTPETTVKVAFPDTVVKAHGQLHGTIEVPKRNIDPAAELFLPDILPAGIGERNLHLTVPVSWR